MNYLKTTLITVLAIIAAASCKSQYDILLESSDIDLKYAAAFDYYEQGKFNRASKLFESLVFLTKGTAKDDTVQFYWGMSNYKLKDYFTAETNFNQFVTNFPTSPFRNTADFYRVDCLYKATLRYELDQTPTYTAMSAISEYLLTCEDQERTDICNIMLQDLGERLDRKAYENAKLYYKMEDYKASNVALKNVLKDDADNIYREEILYYTAMSSYKYALLSTASKQKERYLLFIDDYLNFIGEYPESSHRKELDSLYNKVKEKN